MLIGLEGAHVFYVSIFGRFEHFRSSQARSGCATAILKAAYSGLARSSAVRRGARRSRRKSFMAQSSHKVIQPESTYDVVELIGTSTESWEDAAKNVIEQAGKHLRELRVAKVVDKDMVIRDGKVEHYRTK